MAIPTLAAMAALTLLQNPHMQPEDVTVNYGDMNTYASRVQRYQRRRSRAASKISAAIRSYLSRANTLLGKLVRTLTVVPVGMPRFLIREGNQVPNTAPFGHRTPLYSRVDRLYMVRMDYALHRRP